MRTSAPAEGPGATPVGRLGYAAVGRVSDRETVGARSGKSPWGFEPVFSSVAAGAG